MAPPLLNLDGIKLTFGGTPLLDGAALSASAGEKIALVGRNGSGKSTLLKIVAGLIEPQDGEVFRQPSATVRYDPHRATYLMEHLGLTGEERPNDLSGGEARRAALARVMAPEPDILLLDEPTNHLDLSVIEWLEEELARTSSAVILISHDRRFLERVSRATVWLDRGQTRRLDKGFARFEEWRDQVLEEEEREQHKLGRQIVREEHWLRYGVTARRKRNMRRLGELQAMRQRFRSHRGAEGSATMVASDAAESGKLVIEAKGIEKSFGDLTVVKGFSTRIQRGDRVGLVGPNGVGKTTLLKMLTGELPPDAGTVRLGVNLEIATLDQKREAVDPQETLANYLTDGRGENLVVNGEQRHVVSYMKDFLFKPEQARTPVRELSGGERARLLLARVLARPANLLVLDEPTNDLDMETLELLQELVAGFAGTVVLVSHDRDFLDRTVTSVIAPNGAGRWIEYAGGYSDMLAQRGGSKLEERKARPKAEANEATARAEQTSAKSPAKKLSFKQKFALESLPKKIEAVSASISRLENSIADPSFYERDPASFQKTIAALDKERTTLASLEEEWLELEMLREEMEG
ncbi:MAG: ATP-binding cassette domain-containing protein [Mesorhizobium sp.]|uniref:ABC-F family ATP-binding cassette domain-containing protein n=1 Tax=Mesorhizobium sp. TaxID=1871066 RepID=UPI0011FDD1A8|nr:ATP-binding cassette domain-containing protein [Mesorhizobium sp.]TJV75259.1 MAG: ATP-binding cassette domain-containing protein [Mesorhizobium sp.]